ncbi:copper resistance CopC family protein [Tuberibacillus sp. Marseille-P3662]|uniref:copper resistance CopC family protein n=1 Tax=Tuberibacillus sp. Marseille-P3662 TaxID=1965358 RepID=UPI000A1CEDBE|nr:copper resistance CopC family protein [Tuberibacillus sp. Marseille-P3662]
MIKKILALLTLSLLLFANTSFAHSEIIFTDPVKGATLNKSLENVTITFNTKIEKMSTFKVTDQNDSSLPVEKKNIDGHTATLYLKQPVKDGKYTVVWKLASPDGHINNGDYTITVNRDGNPSSNASGNDEASSSDEGQTAQTEGTSSDTGNQNRIYIAVIAGLIVIAFIGLFFVGRKKKK